MSEMLMAKRMARHFIMLCLYCHHGSLSPCEVTSWLNKYAVGGRSQWRDDNVKKYMLDLNREGYLHGNRWDVKDGIQRYVLLSNGRKYLDELMYKLPDAYRRANTCRA